MAFFGVENHQTWFKEAFIDMNFIKTEYGMVVGPNPEAADAGLEILKAGGNAFDAIVGTAFTEAVVGISNNGIGGYGGCLVGYSAAEGRVVALDYNSRAPRAASEDMFPVEYTEDGVSYTVPGRIHIHGALSVGVPGVVGGLTLAQERFGALSLPEGC